MAWNPQGGGQGPWGRGPIGPQPPDIEELIRRGQENFRRMLPKGLGTGRGISLAAVAIVAVWLASGFYRVEPAERGVELLFGKFWDDATPGLNWFFPAPIGEVLTPNVAQINRVELGFRGAAERTRFGGPGNRDVVEESLMLTADQNLEFQQNLATLPVAVVILVAESNRLESLEPLVPDVLNALKSLKAKTLLRVGP